MKKYFAFTFFMLILMFSETGLCQEEYGPLYGENISINPDDIATSLGLIIVMLSTIWMILLIPVVIIYVYISLAMMNIAKKLNLKNSWLAWIPIANFFLMAQMAGFPAFYGLLMLVPFVSLIMMVIFWIKISKRRGKPNWWGLIISFIPIINLILLGILAWSKDNQKKESLPAENSPQPKPQITVDEKIDKMVEYIKQNLQQGYDINTLRDSLIQQGYGPEFVEKAIQKSQGL